MAECNSIERPNRYPNWNDQQQFRLNKINEIKDYLVADCTERELMSKKPGKYIASFGYFDKLLIVLSVTTGSNSIASFATIIGAPVGIASTSFSLEFSISIRIVKKVLKATQNKKKKHKKTVILVRGKLNSIEGKISEALINDESNHENLMIIIIEKRNYQELKESFRRMKNQRGDTEKINLIERNRH